MLKLFWPLLIVNLRIPGLIWQGAAYFVQNNTAVILPSAKLKAWRHKMFYIFHFFQSDMVLGIERPFFHEYLMPSSVSKVVRFQCLSYYLTLTPEQSSFFPPAESWLANSNFSAPAVCKALGSLSKSLRLTLIRLPEVNFPQNVTLRMCVGCIKP